MCYERPSVRRKLLKVDFIVVELESKAHWWILWVPYPQEVHFGKVIYSFYSVFSPRPG